MKILSLSLLTATLSLSLSVTAQVPFEKDGKWGISKNGSDTDSIIVRADYEEIEKFGVEGPALFAGRRGEEWQMLTANVLVNQQRYEEIRLASPLDGYTIGLRDGYIDIVDIAKEDFVIRGVKADKIVDGGDLLNVADEFAMTMRGKEFYGLVNVLTKKEVFKTEFTRIQELEKPIRGISFLAYKEGKNFAYSKEGKLLHTFDVAGIITKVEASEELPTGLILKVETKKEELMGYYDVEGKWLIPADFQAIESLEKGSDVVAVTNAKGLKGVYFLGKQIVECAYLDAERSDKDSFVAFVVSKKGKQYVTPDGKLGVIE